MSSNLHSSDKQSKNSQVGYGRPPKGRPFKPGVSGNPKGRPKKKLLSEALRDLLGAAAGKLDLTNAEAIAKAIVAEAKKGDVKAFSAIADRTEGKPEQKKTVDENRTITVIFERPEFQNYANLHTDPASVASEDSTRVEALQRTSVRATLREITAGEIPVDRSELG